MKLTAEEIHIRIAQAQLDQMEKVAQHLEKLRAMEREKAENELRKSEIEKDTAEVINRTVRRIESATELPPIKLS